MKTNYELRYAAHPDDARHYDTQRLRRDFLIETLFVKDEVQMVYSMYDRMIVGGAMPVSEELPLEAIDPLKAPFFTTRREVGIFNVGGVSSWDTRKPCISVAETARCVSYRVSLISLLNSTSTPAPPTPATPAVR